MTGQETCSKTCCKETEYRYITQEEINEPKQPWIVKDDFKDSFIVKDSGSRTEFSTGACRDCRSNKGRFDLIDPIMMRRLARLMEAGAEKYGDNNWRKGMPLHCYVDSALRHLYNYLDGEKAEDHLAAVIFNIQGLMYTEEMIKRGKLPAELNDLHNGS